MSNEHIAKSVERVVQHYSAHPEEARSPDRSVSAILEDGLRCKVEWFGGGAVTTDMPKALGGDASAPTPGWLLRAALATSDATQIAMRAAQLGIKLATIEVTVGSLSDDRGLLGMDDEIPAGPLNMHVRMRIGAPGVSVQKMQEIVDWVAAHSAVGDAIRRAVPVTMEVEII